MSFPWQSFPQTPVIVVKFRRRSVDGKHLMLFQSETSVFKFLRRSVDGALMVELSLS